MLTKNMHNVLKHSNLYPLNNLLYTVCIWNTFLIIILYHIYLLSGTTRSQCRGSPAPSTGNHSGHSSATATSGQSSPAPSTGNHSGHSSATATSGQSSPAPSTGNHSGHCPLCYWHSEVFTWMMTRLPSSGRQMFELTEGQTRGRMKKATQADVKMDLRITVLYCRGMRVARC